MAYTPFQGFKLENGKLVETEIEAIRADIAKLLPPPIPSASGLAVMVCTQAEELLPLLQRVIAIQQAGRDDTVQPARNEFGGDNLDPPFKEDSWDAPLAIVPDLPFNPKAVDRIVHPLDAPAVPFTPIKPATSLAEFTPAKAEPPFQVMANSTSEDVRKEYPMAWMAGYECFKTGGLKADNPHDKRIKAAVNDYMARRTATPPADRASCLSMRTCQRAAMRRLKEPLRLKTIGCGTMVFWRSIRAAPAPCPPSTTGRKATTRRGPGSTLPLARYEVAHREPTFHHTVRYRKD